VTAWPAGPSQPPPTQQTVPSPHPSIEVLRRPLESAQYTSIRYTDRLDELGAVRSVGSKGDSYDNSAAESLNSLYKRELIDLRGPWKGISDVTKATMEWVEWYNTKRIHSYCNNVPPLEYEEAFYQSQASAA
jgi:putative transposase